MRISIGAALEMTPKEQVKFGATCSIVAVAAGDQRRPAGWFKMGLISRPQSSSPQIRKKVYRLSNFGPSNPHRDLTLSGPQIRKLSDTKQRELPGALPAEYLFLSHDDFLSLVSVLQFFHTNRQC